MMVSAQVGRLNLHDKSKSDVVLLGLDNCGFQVNQEKSDWELKKCFSWIGYVIDTHFGFIFASNSRTGKLSFDLNELSANMELSAFIHVKKLASIVGYKFSLSSS